MRTYLHNRMAMLEAGILGVCLRKYRETKNLFWLALYDAIIPNYRHHFRMAIGRESGAEMFYEWLARKVANEILGDSHHPGR